jgi:long-chain acyl-CoA synthetase
MTSVPTSASTSAPTSTAVPAPADFRDLPGLIAEHALARPDATALIAGDRQLSYAAFNALLDRVAASLQREGYGPGDCIAICAHSSIEYLAVFIGALRAGLAAAPLAPGSTSAQLAAMAADAGARLVFIDAAVAEMPVPWPAAARVLRLDASGADASGGDANLGAWLMPAGAQPQPVAIQPEWPFNLIYSSGTTGTPKGIVQPHAMRWAHVQRAALSGYGPDCVTLIATPLYSNTTLVSVFPTLGHGGCVVLMPKFDALAYLQLAQRHRATHTMLVPVQYSRLMARPEFGQFDLSSFRYKFSTSAPFHAELKADVLARWPGALVEYYGMTEGGGTVILQAHLFPHKLHTVGQPAEGHDVRLIDEDGVEIPRTPGGASAGSGEVVGRSGSMMSGYHGLPELSAAAEWFDGEGQRYIRTGDVGRFDEDGFLVLHDRRKDMIISGGFNIYPSDLEAVLRQHPAVADAAVVGVPSAEWGETPVAFVVRRAGHGEGAETIRSWVNEQVGKTQRLSALQFTEELPRSAIGKVLKRELRDGWQAPTQQKGNR